MGFHSCPAWKQELADRQTTEAGEPHDHQLWIEAKRRETAALPERGVLGACSAAAQGGSYVF